MKPILVFFTSWALAAGLMAQDTDGGQRIVIEELSRAELETEILLIEDELYAIFNANNADDELDITCRMETPTGTHFQRRVCEPRFLSEARRENNNNFANGLESQLSEDVIRAGLNTEFAQLESEFERLGRENPIFAQLGQILSLLRARLAQL